MVNMDLLGLVSTANYIYHSFDFGDCISGSESLTFVITFYLWVGEEA